MRSLHVIVRGRVQGVGFRAWVEMEAGARRLSGWVRNRRNGTVEAVIAGEAAAVDAMLRALREGPPAARVEALEVAEWADPVPPGFEMRPTA